MVLVTMLSSSYYGSGYYGYMVTMVIMGLFSMVSSGHYGYG